MDTPKPILSTHHETKQKLSIFLAILLSIISNEQTTSATGQITAVPFHFMPHSLAMQTSVGTNHVYVI
jgi:hypothetical protein